MEQLNCFICRDRVAGSLDGLTDHFIRIHGMTISRDVGVHGFVCGQNGCTRRYRHFYSLRHHIRRNHLNNEEDELNEEPPAQIVDHGNVPDDEAGIADNIRDVNAGEDEQIINPPPNNDDSEIDLRSYVIKIIARFQCKESMTTATCIEILDECEQLLLTTRSFLKTKVHNYFHDKGLSENDNVKELLDSLEFPSPFEGLRTLQGQIEALQTYCDYIEPIEVPLGYRMDSGLDRTTSTYRPKMVMETCQYVPIIESIQLVLSSPQILHAIENEQKSPNGVVSSFLDGQYFNSHPLFSRFPHAIRIQLYYDEFDVVNPLGSKTSIHKLGAFYYTIQNLPLHMNSELNSIHVLCLCSYIDIQKYGFHKILKPFLEDLAKLESDEGVIVDFGHRTYVLRGSIVAFCGDELAIHDVYNLLGPLANQFCRMCMYNRDDLHAGFIELGRERSENLFNEHLALLERTNYAPDSITATGVRGYCCLNNSRYFHISTNKVFDPMHDFLCGICPMIVKLILYEYIINQRKFDLTYFNARVSSFAYGITEKINKPSANFTENMLRRREHVLSQKAVQMWCLIRAFPFLVHGCIPDDDEHMILLLNLLRIMELVFAPKMTFSLIAYLHQLIIGFFQDFKRLFPDVNAINKFYHMFYYPDCIMWAGPMVHYWCMRYEAKHGVMKTRAQVIKNFKNPPKTLVRIAQCGQSAKWGGKNVSIHSITTLSPKMAYVSSTLSRRFLHGLNYSDGDRVYCSTSVRVNNVEFRPNMYVCFEVSRVREDNLPLFGYIKEIILIDGAAYSLILICTTISFDTDLNSYHIKKNENTGLYRFIPISNLAYFKPLSCWSKPGSNNLYINLRHILL